MNQVVEHPPHVYRLLRLISEGTPSHASRASKLLAAYCSSCPGMKIWDIIGLLLCGGDDKVNKRQGSKSRKKERPTTGLFDSNWETRENCAMSLENVARCLPVGDRRHFFECVLDQARKPKAESAGANTWLDVRDLSDASNASGESQIDIVANLGRHLLVKSCEWFDSDDDDGNQYAQEHAALRSLDAAREKLSNPVADDDEEPKSFVTERVALQRRILARRLGLGGILGTSVVTGKDQPLLSSSIVDDEDLFQPKKKLKRGKAAKGKEEDQQSDNGIGNIRPLLVLESGRTEGTAKARLEHHNPQMLLGSELAYRMFDAEWSIRHGALLGTLAILRAWRVHDSNQVFGTWPNDCLARCLCILVLDQFTDFGEDIAVAPIRETAAQIIAVLLETAPSDIRRKSFDVLVHLYSRGQTRPGCAGWEIRQGVLLTWRYIMALKERDNHTRRKLRCIPQQEENLEAEKTILNLSIRSLIDPNDDNKAISAQILARAFKCNYPLSDEDKKDCYLNVWVSMETLREGVSSCAADLLSLLACILTKDLHSFVGCMQGKSVDSIELILRKIVGLESDPSNSIRTSSYTAHSLIVVPVTKLYASKQKQPVKLADFFCQVLVGIFETHFSAGEHGDDLSSARGQAWSATLESLLLVAGDTTDKLVSRTVGNLILRHLAAVNGSVVVGKFGSEQEYRSRLSTSMALSEIFEKLLPDETISTFVQALAVVIDSPYPFQAEFSCTLLTSVASCIPQEILYKINESLEIPPSCVRLFGNVQYSSFLDDSMIRVICNKGLAMLFDTSVNFTQHDMRSMWRSVFIKKGIDLGALPSCSTDTSGSVRIASSLAGIIVSSHCRLRAITPVARALVTSLNNEDSCARMIETSRFTSSLVIDLSSDVVSHKKAKDKLIENVCSAACNQSKSQSSLGGQIAIKMMIKNLESFQGLETLGPLYLRISPLAANHSISCGQTASQALIILHTITEAISKGSSFDAIVEMLPAVVNVACSSSSNDLGSRSTLSIKNLCRIDLALTMDKMLPSLLSALSDMADDDKRVGGCRLLSSVLTEFEVRMAKYVLSLLPTAMRLMTDPKEECSRLATNAFAILVRVAPLSAEYIDDKDIHQTNNVVQHLILGKPLPPVVLPEVLKYELATSGVNLRPYQEEGISWLKFLAEVGLNGALCDDMGLGKTLQALVAIAASNFNGSSKSLIVAPSSVVGHWHSELIKYFPSGKIFKPIKYTGSKRKRLHFQDVNVIVTSYSILRSDIDILTDTVWNYVVLDEGHLLKNTKTATAKASRRLKAEHKLILTGTPLQNSVNEIWASFDFLMPNFLGNSSEFTREFSKPVMKAMSPEASAEDIASGMDALKILHQTTLPFILRRTKAQVLQDLPPKIISDIPCALSGQQRPLYEKALASSGTKEALQFVDNCLSDGGQADSSLSARPPGSDVLTSLIRLRLICTHPLLGSDESSLRSCGHTIALSRLDCSGKLQALNDLLRQAGIAEPEMAAADNDETGYAVLDHYCNGDELEDDPTELLDFHAEDQQRLSNTARADRSKCLIFCQFSQSLDILERLLFEAHMPTLQYLRLDGSVPANRRNEVAQEFNSDPAVRVLLLSTKVGSLGLNLCAADMVVMFEPDWNPFVDLQAIDRAHRIGQKKSVNVYRFVTTGAGAAIGETIEEKMMSLQRKKTATSDAVVNTANSSLYSMGTDRLLDVFTCRGGGGGDAPEEEDVPGNQYKGLTVDSFLKSLQR